MMCVKHKSVGVICTGMLLWAAVVSAVATQDARILLNNAVKAMGIADIRTLTMDATGSTAGIGQNRNPEVAWPVTRIKSYARQIDFDAGVSVVAIVRTQNGVDQSESQYIGADSPWNTRFSLWTTPSGFLKGALASTNAVTSTIRMDGRSYAMVTYNVQGGYKVVGYINDQNFVERVQTWIDNDVLGDMLVEFWFSDYKDFNGFKFPSIIVEKQAGFPVTILAVSGVRPNAAVNITPPPAAPVPPAPSAAVQTEKIADGVYYLKGGTHHSVAVEFSDYVALIEAPLNEQRSLALIDEIRRLVPGKPIRYVISTHHHFDHSGGLRAFVDTGVTVVTNETNRRFFEAALAAPRTQNPDRLARSGKKPVLEVAADKKVFSDSGRTMELHLIRDNPHHDGILMAFLPKEKLLIEADVFTPAATSATPAAVSPAAVNLVDNVERLKLDYETILPLHGPGHVPRADLYAAIRKPLRDMKDILNAQPPAPAGQRPGQTAAAVPTGQQLLDKACTSCHNLNRIENKQLNEADWRATVVRMQGRGADLPDSDVSALVQYLFKTYGPQ